MQTCVCVRARRAYVLNITKFLDPFAAFKYTYIQVPGRQYHLHLHQSTRFLRPTALFVCFLEFQLKSTSMCVGVGVAVCSGKEEGGRMITIMKDNKCVAHLSYRGRDQDNKGTASMRATRIQEALWGHALKRPALLRQQALRGKYPKRWRCLLSWS
jgi:hypothetical protein